MENFREKQKLILHIGMAKTGSTALQMHFHGLSNVHFFYPRIGIFPTSSCPNHTELFYPLVKDPITVLTPLPEPRFSFKEQANQIKNAARKLNCPLIISSEMLWNAVSFTKIELEEIKSEFAEFEIQVLAFLRNPETHVFSSYAQRVCGAQGYVGTFSENVSELIARGTWDYQARYNEYCSVFGEKNVHFLSYEKHRKEIVKPIYGLLNVPYQASNPITNRRKPWISVTIMRYGNSVGRGTFRGFAARLAARFFELRFVRPAAELLDTRFRPTPSASREFHEVVRQAKNFSK